MTRATTRVALASIYIPMNCSLCGSTNAEKAVACAACGAALSAVAETSAGDALPAGTTLQNGVFRIDAVLGQGGFGITYRGFDLQLQRPVAVKEFFPFGCRRFPAFNVQPSQSLSLSSYGTFKSRFVEEARVLARFKHPAIVDVYSVWEENNAAYMVMELLEGQTLEQVLHARNKPLEESEVLGLAQRIGEALSEVHRRGLLHRDIKPANIVQCDDGRVMLIDFGTAREYSKDAPTMQGHSVVVTPGYAPLEQYAERATRGAYTDVYSLAATLYHLLTGEMPPAASDRALGVELRPAHELNPQISPIVSAALSCAMETLVARRPQSVDEFLKMLHGQRAAALAPQFHTEQSSTRLSSVVEAKREPQEETLSTQPQDELMSDEARQKLATMFEDDMLRQYQTGTAARKAFLESFPSALVTSPSEFSQQDALAALVASQGTPNSSLQQTSAS
ncbi:MAG TPA: serine/threonine-protein kinase, partial [Abditibacteriaceae bacterium]|nr:serine/threonine-protein kinase [Abditibacteriaceae bacterium]